MVFSGVVNSDAGWGVFVHFFRQILSRLRSDVATESHKKPVLVQIGIAIPSLPAVNRLFSSSHFFDLRWTEQKWLAPNVWVFVAQLVRALQP